MSHNHSHAPRHHHGDQHHPHDHNGATELTLDHLHSHPHGDLGHEEDDAIDLLADAFVAGYDKAEDKIGFLRLADVPFEIAGDDGGPSLKLIEVQRLDCHQVGSASPGFASRELVYHPYTGSMVRERSELSFVYISLDAQRKIPLREHLTAKFRAAAG